MRKTDQNIIEIAEDTTLLGTGIILEKGDRIRVVEERLPQENIVRGWVRDKLSNNFPGKAYSDYKLDARNMIGWFANKYNIAGGWIIFKSSDTDKRTFGSKCMRTYSEHTNTMSIAMFSISTGTYAFLDNAAYDDGTVRYDKMTAYDRLIIEPTDIAFQEFNII